MKRRAPGHSASGGVRCPIGGLTSDLVFLKSRCMLHECTPTRPPTTLFAPNWAAAHTLPREFPVIGPTSKALSEELVTVYNVCV